MLIYLGKKVICCLKPINNFNELINDIIIQSSYYGTWLFEGILPFLRCKTKS